MDDLKSNPDELVPTQNAVSPEEPEIKEGSRERSHFTQPSSGGTNNKSTLQLSNSQSKQHI
jgi:hypothetical protein